ncbi:MAG: circadian clock protein KaiC [Thermoplasmatota archaeon]
MSESPSNQSIPYNDIIQELKQNIDQKPTEKDEKGQILSDQSYEHSESSIESLKSSATGIVEFDMILDGGFPKGAVVLLAGSSGSGKTIFSFQWLFEGVNTGENGVYISLTEPLFKIVQNLEKMSFYDRTAVEQEKIRIVDMRDCFSGPTFDANDIISFIEKLVKEGNVKRLCIDSITAVAYHCNEKAGIRSFIFQLGKMLATLGCTTILTSEVSTPGEFSVYDVEEFISDAILRLDQAPVKDMFQRQLRIVKVRGKSFQSESIPIKISSNGLSLFPKIHPPLRYQASDERVSTGNNVLDEMIGDGVIQQSSTLLAGSTGTGKTLLSLAFIIDGLRNDEHCLFVGFEESRDQLFKNASAFGWDLASFEQKGLLHLYCAYPSDHLLEEHFSNIQRYITENKVKRCAVDSLSAISHEFIQEEFSSFAIRLNGFLKNKSVTSFFTAATDSLIGGSTLVGQNLSTLTDGIIMLRYVEMQGKLESVINVLKMRGSQHKKDLRRYVVDPKEGGVSIKESLTNFEGVMTGSSKRIRELEKESERLKQLIKEKEETKKLLEKSEKKYRTIFDNSPLAIMLTDEHERLVSWNHQVETLLGMGTQDLHQTNIKTLYPREEWEKIRQEQVRKKGIKQHLETKMKRKDNTLVEINLSLRVIKDKNEQVIGSIGIIEDISEKKQLELEMKIKDSAILSSIEAVAFIDLDGEVTYVNPSFLNMWEFNSEKEILGKTFESLWANKEKYAEVREVLFEKEGWFGEFISRKNNGKVFQVQLSASLVRDDNNDPLCVMASFIDNKRKKQMSKSSGSLKLDLSNEKNDFDLDYDFEEELR